MDMWIIWLIIILFLAFVEVNTVNLVSIWFIASGIVSLVVSIFYDNFYLQFAIFVVLGILLLLTTRKFLNNLIKPNNEKTNLDRIIGEDAIVTEPIKKNVIGEVKIDGKRWSAISTDKIDEGELVTILRIEGVKLVVKKKE